MNVWIIVFGLPKNLEKQRPKLAYEFLKIIDAEILMKNVQWSLRTEEVNISIFYYNINYISILASILIRYMNKD